MYSHSEALLGDALTMMVDGITYVPCVGGDEGVIGDALTMMVDGITYMPLGGGESG